jgi:hypothetical protein
MVLNLWMVEGIYGVYFERARVGGIFVFARLLEILDSG